MPRSARAGPRQTLNAAVAHLCAAQLGLISRQQAAGLGLSKAAIHRRIQSGQWARVLPNVYRAVCAPWSDAQQLAAAALWAGPGAAISHRTALSAWGVVAAVHSLELITPRRRSPLPGMTLHQVRRLPAHHVTVRAGIPTTTAERTLMDVAGLGDDELLRQVIPHFFENHHVTFESVHLFLEDPSTRGLPGRRALRKALWERGRCAWRLPSSFEDSFRLFLKKERLPPTRVAFEGDIKIPVAYPEHRIAFVHPAKSDVLELRALQAEGWQVLLIDPQDLLEDPEYCALRVAAAIAKAGGPTHPPRRRANQKRPWLSALDRMRVQERITEWRRGWTGWFLLHEGYPYAPSSRMTWRFQCAMAR